MNSIRYSINGLSQHVMNISKFPGGEVHVSVPNHAYPSVIDITITASIDSSDAVMALLLSTDALKNRFPQAYSLNLVLPYMPYARQDRVCNKGEALSVKVMANLINSVGFDSIIVCDPHSEVTCALLNNVREIPVESIIPFSQTFGEMFKESLVIAAPDAGATKKVFKVAKTLNTPFVQCGKTRDVATGELSGFEVYGEVRNKDVLIVDDICDGGGTFIGLAAKLYEQGANNVFLYVTHGIFSKGVDVLLKNGINRIITTDSYPSGITHDRLEIIGINSCQSLLAL